MNRWLRYSLAGFLTLLLVANVAWDAWNSRPYIVTGISSEHGGRLSASYTLPDGGDGLWESDLRFVKGFWCWDKAEIGKVMPDCMRANWKARTAD